jgi:hypothetical protein
MLAGKKEGRLRGNQRGMRGRPFNPPFYIRMAPIICSKSRTRIPQWAMVWRRYSMSKYLLRQSI